MASLSSRFRIFNAKSGILAFLLLTALPAGLLAEFSGWITEIYAKGGADYAPADWMEIYCAADGAVTGSKVYHVYTDTGSIVKTMPAITVKKGDYIIIHFSDPTTADETDATGDTNGNGLWDLYSPHNNSTRWGISLSKGAAWITKMDGATWVDYVTFIDIDADSTWNDNLSNKYSSATARSQWSPTESGSWTYDDYKINSVDTSDRDTGISLQRRGGSDGDPEDTNTKADWEMAATSKGEGYFIPQAISGRLKINNSPFFPHGDNTSQSSVGSITYKLDSANYNVTIAVYDINGYVVKYLLHDYPITSGEGGLTWNGYDEMGNVVPTGIYIVQLSAENRDTGEIKKSHDSIAVGRKF
ncbi:MAG: FlgD immunoglobulin-like domain containing protein [Elusimicrobiota bacterium]